MSILRKSQSVLFLTASDKAPSALLGQRGELAVPRVLSSLTSLPPPSSWSLLEGLGLTAMGTTRENGECGS